MKPEEIAKIIDSDYRKMNIEDLYWKYNLTGGCSLTAFKKIIREIKQLEVKNNGSQ